MQTITLSLISHTNVGKTTLTRTLLGRDVGEVRDEAHVTMESERFDLLETADARLILWDTPGFGDSARLLARLRKQKSPLGWFLHQVWDRLRDRGLYSSQEAVRNVSEEADVVLYLVNATEHPDEAGYVDPELEILSYVERPILALLNQTGPAGGDTDAALAAWRAYLEAKPNVAGILPLDAFSRCWVQEGVLFERLAEGLPEERRPAMRALADAWKAERLEQLDRTVERIAGMLAETAGDRVATRASLAGAMDRPAAMKALAERLAARERRLWDTVLEDHKIEGSAAAELNRAIENFEVQGATQLEPKTGALLGAILSGALSGLAADAMTGGLSLGGGMIAGGLIGALGGAGLTKAYQLFQGDEDPGVAWSAAALTELAQRSLVRYLAVAHFGRGRGAWRDEDEPEAWRAAAARVLPESRAGLAPQVFADAAAQRALEQRLERTLGDTLRKLLTSLYPDARL